MGCTHEQSLRGYKCTRWVQVYSMGAIVLSGYSCTRDFMLESIAVHFVL